MNDASRPQAAHTLGEDESIREVGGCFTPSASLSVSTAPLPVEPLEQLEPSAPSSATGRLYGDGDGSDGIRDETVARLRAPGIQVALFKSFRCVIPDHDHKARVVFTRFREADSLVAGRWQYYCDGLARGVGLAEVRAFLAYGDARSISNLEAARWREQVIKR